MQPDHQMKDKT